MVVNSSMHFPLPIHMAYFLLRICFSLLLFSHELISSNHGAIVDDGSITL